MAKTEASHVPPIWQALLTLTLATLVQWYTPTLFLFVQSRYGESVSDRFLGVTTITTCAAIASVVILACLIGRCSIPKTLYLARPSPVALVAVVLAPFVALSTMPLENLLRAQDPSAMPPPFEFESALLVVGMVVIGPFAEELLYRGYLMRAFSKHHVWLALVVTSVLFGASHVGGASAVVMRLPFALSLGALVLLSGSLYPALVGHMAANACALFTPPLRMMEATPLRVAGGVGFVLVALASIYFLRRQRRLMER